MPPITPAGIAAGGDCPAADETTATAAAGRVLETFVGVSSCQSVRSTAPSTPAPPPPLPAGLKAMAASCSSGTMCCGAVVTRARPCARGAGRHACSAEASRTRLPAQPRCGVRAALSGALCSTPWVYKQGTMCLLCYSARLVAAADNGGCGAGHSTQRPGQQPCVCGGLLAALVLCLLLWLKTVTDPSHS